MTDANWPSSLEVPFDPESLHRERMAALRAQRIAAWGWLGLSIAATIGLLLPVLGSHLDGLEVLAWIWVLLIAGMLFVSSRSFVALARCSTWTDGLQPKTAIRVSEQGLWIEGVPQYEWTAVRGLLVKSTFGRRYLTVDLEPGTRPDHFTIAGLAELHSPGRRRSFRARPGPRALIETFSVTLSELDTALMHYSNGKVGIQ